VKVEGRAMKIAKKTLFAFSLLFLIPRLFGVDCPEKRQAFGKRAKQFTSSLVFGKVVNVTPVTKDRYGRTVALVSVNRKLLNEELIKNGLAWVYNRCCHKALPQA